MVKLERRGRTAVLVLDRPDVGNALNDEMVVRIFAVLDEVRADSDLRALVVTGSGKIFSAGADLNWMKRMQDASREENLRDAVETARVFATLYDFPLPVIAAVNGPARGGGVGLVASCDFAIASERANFAFTEVRLGLVPAMISPFVLRKMGESRARRLFLTGEIFGAEKSLAWGLIDRVVPGAELEGAVDELIGSLAGSGPLAIGGVKRLIREVSSLSYADAAGPTARMIAEMRTTPEAQEGMAAFLGKRPPKWAAR